MQDGGGTAPDCPDWLPERAKAHWPELIGKLQDLGVELHPVDADALSVYCELFTRYQEEPQKVNAATLTQMRLIWEKFGMTNGSRQALGLRAKKPEPNPFADL